MSRLGVNIDHVATLRQARRAKYPDPLAAALVAERAGADQITVHLRGDRRHIQDHDLFRLQASVQTFLNVEAACTDDMWKVLEQVRPRRVTLVEERPGEVTTEGGLDVARHGAEVQEFATRLSKLGIRVALFVDPMPEQIAISRKLVGVDMVELNTAAYAEADVGSGGAEDELSRLARACEQARGLGLQVAAGHGLTLHNLGALVSAAPGIEEYNIGHALVGDALFFGFDESVRRYKAACG
ncbi:MAG: pyridoxine 5'-phosphate synthase [Pseudomonadota bacterium]|nr:pyridoxine 5'-phosphate synthase [Pseudomonadota bacterium]